MLIISLCAFFAASLVGYGWALKVLRQRKSPDLATSVVNDGTVSTRASAGPATGIRARRRQARLLSELPDCLSQMASSMQAGATLATAMRWYIDESSGPLAQELAILQHEHRLGAHLEDALHRLGTRVKLQEMDLVVCAMLVARETGGNLAGVLSQLSASVRQQLEIKNKISALTAQGVMQGWIVSLLPVLVGAALFVLDPLAIQPLFAGLLGWIFLSIIVLLELMGAVLIWRIVNIDV